MPISAMQQSRPVLKSVLFGGSLAELGFMAKLHYHHQFESTDITPYVTFGVGGGAKVSQPAQQGQQPDVKKFFLPDRCWY
ncbi:UNVERIFIED_CONTAM: hypothetical protein LBW93_00290 [Wolbachia endosymbiont of Nasonia longicornis]